ncbi:MAG: HDIG domain-containing metalloprotein [Gemmatimonadota bacterium]|nr:HDIG domain-containing metalloprotein [Gemmatimonadota bacterium]
MNGPPINGKGEIVSDSSVPLSQKFIFHGLRILLVVVLVGFVIALFPPKGAPVLGSYFEGLVLSDPVIAEISFTVPKSASELQRDRSDAAAGVPPTFRYRPEATDSMRLSLNRFFDQLDSLAYLEDEGVLRVFLLDQSLNASTEQASSLLDIETRRLLRDNALLGAQEYALQGIVDAGQARELNTDRVLIQDPGIEDRRSISSEEILIGGDFHSRVADKIAGESSELREFLRLVMIRNTIYSLVFDAVVTEADREQARQAVPQIKGNVVEQEAIVRANEPITAEDLERLTAYGNELRRIEFLEESGLQLRLILGAFLMSLTIIGIFSVLLHLVRPAIYASMRSLLLLSGLVMIYFLVARIVGAYGLPVELLPISFVILPVAVLWDSRFALLLGFVMTFLTVAQPPFYASSQVLFLTMVGAGAAALSVRVLRRRAQTLVFATVISAGYAIVLLALTFLEQKTLSDLMTSVMWTTLNAFLSAFVAMGFVTMFEWFTGITTDQTLLEWADPNRPLLRRLSQEAPGTYAHSVNAANLGESAANAIGAHGLLVRIGMYYHDAGKVLKPQYFIENQPEGLNPHDSLDPVLSAAIVKEHVTEGARLAKESNLPVVIQDFITEHHGTQFISIFYNQAIERNGKEKVTKQDFTYPGPKPQSKETAIAMMADSIESATRVLQEPNAKRLRNLVEKIIQNKQEEGQLDESPLTLAEITILKEAFANSLASIHHQRIEYPTSKHLTKSPEKTAGTEPTKIKDEEQIELEDMSQE